MTDLTDGKELITRGRQLLELLGSFWNSLYGGWTQIASYVNAKNQIEMQTYRDLSETIASLSRFDIPIYHRKNWALLTVKQSEQLAGQLIQYGDDDIVFGNNPAFDGHIFQYGVSIETSSDFPNPDRFKECSVIMNRITAPTVILTKGVDFVIDPETNSIRFKDDPFDNTAIPSRPVYGLDGSVVDTEASLWLFMSDYDFGYIYEQFGYALNIYLSESSQNYKDMLNAVWSAILTGTTYAHLEMLLAGLTDTPLTIEQTETIEDIYIDTNDRLVITDRHVYRVPIESILTIAVGDILTAGTPLTDAFTIYNPYRDIIPAAKVPEISIGSGFLLGTYTGDITFSNETVAVETTIDTNGRTKVTFELGGLYSDIQTFWDTVHTNGTAEDSISLAQLMDSRYPPAQSPDPTGVNIQPTVNPLDFLVKNILRNNALIVCLNVDSFGPNALGVNNSQLLRMITPPQTALLIVAQPLL